MKEYDDGSVNFKETKLSFVVVFIPFFLTAEFQISLLSEEK